MPGASKLLSVSVLLLFVSRSTAKDLTTFGVQTGLLANPSLCGCSGSNAGLPAATFAGDAGVNASYGTSCQPWDQYANYCTDPAADAAWCTKSWCYISKECVTANPGFTNLHYIYASSRVPTKLYYSYHHCAATGAEIKLQDSLVTCNDKLACPRKGEHCVQQLGNPPTGKCTQTSAGFIANHDYTGPNCGTVMNPSTCTNENYNNHFCAPGSIAPVKNSIDCEKCGTGKYAGGKASLVCDCTKQGFYASTVGASAELPCAKGTFTNDTCTVNCKACGDGKYASSTGKKECDCTNKGYTPNAGKTAQTACDQGSYAAAECSATCTLCEVGRTQHQTAAEKCTPCNKGTAMGTEGSKQTYCDSCLKGKYQDGYGGAACKACQGGKFASQLGSQNCSCAEAGYVPNAGATDVTGCGAGTYSDTKCAASCKPCAAGTIAQSNTSNAACFCTPAGYTPNRAKTAPQACVPGSFSNATCSAECTACSPGSTQGGYHAGYCVPCGLGTEMPKAGSATDHCDSCKPGHYQDEFGQPLCKACEAGRHTEVINAANCSECLIGYYQDLTGQELCKVCPAGKITSTRGQAEAVYCGYTQYSKGHNSKGEGGTECGSCFTMNKMFGVGAEGFNLLDWRQHVPGEHQCILTAHILDLLILIALVMIIRYIFAAVMWCLGKDSRLSAEVNKAMEKKEREHERKRRKHKKERKHRHDRDASDSDSYSDDYSSSDDETARTKKHHHHNHHHKHKHRDRADRPHEPEDVEINFGNSPRGVECHE